MKAIAVPLLIAGSLLLCAGPGCLAQRNANPETFYRAPSTQHGKVVLIPVGTTFEGRIDTSIGSSISRHGQPFTIEMSAPVLANGTDVLIPSGSQIMGEVVEAIPADRQQHIKGAPKPRGKLRVQLSGLRTPDGQQYPLVASITGETIMMGRKQMANSGMGGGTAYMGSSASFEAVAPGMENRARNSGRGPTVVSKGAFARDPIWGGMDKESSMNRMGKPVIRSLVQRGSEVYIDEGSPLTIKLDAPFRIGFNPPEPQGAPMSRMDDELDSLDQNGGKRFARSRSSAPAAPVDAADPLLEDSSGTAGGGTRSAAPPPAEQQAPAPQSQEF